MRYLGYSIVFCAIAAVTWIGLTIAMLAVVFAEGGGVSCYEVCTPTQEFMDEHDTALTLMGFVVSCAAGLAAVHLTEAAFRRRSVRSGAAGRGRRGRT